MNKTKIILAATGGVMLLAVLAAAVFVFLSFSAKTAALEGDDEEGVDGLETVLEKAETLSKKPVFPCAESVKAIDESRAILAQWREDAFRLAAKGDRPIPPTTPAQFKADIVNDARLLADLPQGTTNKIVAAEFEFGPFKPYISGGEMPEMAALATLQRQWDDVKTLVGMLASAGVTRVEKLDVKAVKAAEPEEEAKPKKGKPKRTAKSDEVEVFKPATQTYEIVCKVRPSAFVKALNAFATSERFIVVDDFSLALERDAIAAAFGSEAKKDDAPVSGRRRRRQQAAEEEAEKTAEAEAPKVTPVTDPATDATFVAVLTITVHDFKSLEETKEEEETK